MGFFDFLDGEKRQFNKAMKEKEFIKDNYKFIDKESKIEVYLKKADTYIHLFNMENRLYSLDLVAFDPEYKNIFAYCRDNNLATYSNFMLIVDNKESFIENFHEDIRHLNLFYEFTKASRDKRRDFNIFGFKFMDLFKDTVNLKREEREEIIDKGTYTYTLKDGRKLYYFFHKSGDYSSGQWIMIDDIKDDISEKSDFSTPYGADPKVKDNGSFTIPEAVRAMERIASIKFSLDQLKNLDEELYSEFNETLKSIGRVARYLVDHKNMESKGFLYYNQVELAEKWLLKILDIKKYGASGEDLNIIKKEALEALPILRKRIDEEYDRFIRPGIEDLKAEMDVMSKFK